MITQIDFSILDFIKNIFGCDFLDAVMSKITYLGNGGLIWIVVALCFLCFPKYRKCGFVLLITLATGAILGNIILKPLIARPRPCHLNTEIMLLIKAPSDFSFPSGHTLSSVSAAVIIAYINKKFGYFAIPVAFLIAFSRLYLYVHFPSDIIAGAVIGFLISYSFIKIFKLEKIYH